MSVNVPYKAEHEQMAKELVEETRANGGLAPVDIDRFWADDEEARKNPFGKNIPQVPFGAKLTHECVFDELGVEEDMWRYGHDREWRLKLNKEYNEKSLEIVGRKLLPETLPEPDMHYRYYALNDVFEAENEWHAGSWWLQQVASNEQELEALLDRVDKKDIPSIILPDDWEEQKKRLSAAGVKMPLYRGQRGPVTFAASIYGSENLIELVLLNPELAQRFNDTILRVMLEIGKLIDAEAGYAPEERPRGFAFCDDNCVLMTPEMYQIMGYGVLKGMFDYYSPDPGNGRFQHSDSAMGHLLPQLGELGLTACNFGPTVMPDEIREHLPKAVIHGQLAPFTYSRNEEENIVMEFLRDFEMTKESRGLIFGCAGSINNGTRLTSMRLAMATIQRYGRYDN